MRKYFFFDIDGTLTNSNPGGIILPSTFETLDKLRKNGHFNSIWSIKLSGRSLKISRAQHSRSRSNNVSGE